VGRFTGVDPIAGEFAHVSTYNYASNDPVKNIDLHGLQGVNINDIRLQLIPITQEDAVRSAQGVLFHTSYTGVRSSQVRQRYKNIVSNLDPSDSKGRTHAKVEARSKTPIVTRRMAESMRPISGESKRIGGTANKSNVGVNKAVETLGKVGKAAGVAGIGISVYNVAAAEDKSKAVAEEIGAIAGGIAGGEAGALVGSAIGAGFGGIGAVPGAIIGAIIGSVGGSNAGAAAGGAVHDAIVDDKKNDK